MNADQSRGQADEADLSATIDFSAERPGSALHGLHPDGTTKWLLITLAGGLAVLLVIVAAVRWSMADDRSASKVAAGTDGSPRVRAFMAAPLSAALTVLESVRTEAITIATVRAMGNGSVTPARATGKPLGGTPVAVAARPGTASTRAAAVGDQGRADPMAALPSPAEAGVPTESKPSEDPGGDGAAQGSDVVPASPSDGRGETKSDAQGDDSAKPDAGKVEGGKADEGKPEAAAPGKSDQALPGIAEDDTSAPS